MQLVFATHNPNKLREVQALMPKHIQLLGLTDIGCTEEIPETAKTIQGNAQLKVDHVTQHYGHDCFADDTGLEVNALNKAPGVYSARYAGPQKNSDDNMQKLLHELDDQKDRSAQFKTVIALNLNGQQHFFEGIARGTILYQKRGDQGFGYDPIFQPLGYEHTFAELSMQEKNQLAHRGIAVRKLIAFLESL